MARPGPKRAQRPGDETKARIVAAAIESLHEEGILGASARAIARRAEVNQGLIFYHFGTVDELLLAAVDELSLRRSERYTARLEAVSSLRELVAVAGELHREDFEEGHMTVLSQMLAAAAANPALRAPLRERFDPWIGIVEKTVARVIDGTPYAQLVPVHDLAIAITSLFLGLELLLNIEDEGVHPDHQIFGTLQMLAAVLESMLDVAPGGPPT